MTYSDRAPLRNLDDLLVATQCLSPIRVAVVNAGQRAVLESVHDATRRHLVVPVLIGDPTVIETICHEIEFQLHPDVIVAARTQEEAAARGVALVHEGQADAVMKGDIHTDVFMHALLHESRGLRLPGRRVSHLFVIDVPTYPKLLAVTDAAINIAPDLNAKVQIVNNAVELFRLLGIATPKVAVLSAVETVNPAIVSSVDAASLSVMARRGQIANCLVDGPLAFDNAISLDAAEIKSIESEVAGDVDVLLVPDLVSGNVLAKNLEYLAGATAAGIVLGLSAPVVLSSRADPPHARLAALALAALMHGNRASEPAQVKGRGSPSAIHCLPQSETVCSMLAHNIQ